jgi:hypothetical protein
MKTMINKTIFVLFLVAGFLLSMSEANAREYNEDTNNSASTFMAKQAAGRGISTWINVNGISSFFDWQGITGFNPNTNSSGTEYPKYQVGVIYRDGLVWGGLVRDPARARQKFVNGNTYVVGTIPGKIVGGSPEDWEAYTGGGGLIRVYRIRADWREMGTAVLTEDAAAVFNTTQDHVTQTEIDVVVEQYGLDWAEWPADRGAPYYDVDNSGTYNPVRDANDFPIMPEYDELGNITEGGDYPGYGNGDQVLWYVLNDLSIRSNDFAGSDPVGLEIQTTVWAYNVSAEQALGNVFFKKYVIENHSAFDIDSMYLAQWSDPDLGAYSNDVVGCDSVKSLMFAYNGEPVDAQFAAFGLAPGAAGYDFLQGPIVEAPGDSAIFLGERIYDFRNLDANAFTYFTAGGDPAADPDQGNYTGTKQWYNMLQGYLPTDTDVPTTRYTTVDGEPTFFPLSGVPWTGEGDLDGQLYGPADRRMSISTGPFTCKAGDVQEVVVGEIAAVSTNYLASVAKMVYYDRAVQEAYDNFFDVPKPPAQPKIVATPLGDQILLDWGGDATAVSSTEANGPLYKFEGYNVYQYDPQFNAVKIATYDVSNGVQAILQDVFDDESGNVLRKPVQIGTDSGIRRFIALDKDYFTQGKFAPGHTYYFAVTAYNYTSDETVLTRSVENSLIRIAVVAQGSKPGDDLSSASGGAGDMLEVTRESGASDGGINAYIINPMDLKTQDFRVEFTGPLSYTMINATTGDTLLKDYQNAAYADETDEEADDPLGLRVTTLSPSFDGVAVEGYGPPIGAKEYSYAGGRWVTGVNWGGAIFFNGADVGDNFFGSTHPVEDTWLMHSVWQDQADVDANGYVSKGWVYRSDLGYARNGLGDIPAAFYDMTDAENPRRVNVLFRETDFGDGNTNANNIWDMGWDGAGAGTGWSTAGSNIYDLGAREYLFIMNTDYAPDGGPYVDGVGGGPAADVVWAIWPKNRSELPYLNATFTMDFIPYFPNKSGVDVFTFSTTAGTTGDDDLARAQFDKATVWPNPYYAYNTQETSNFGRFVTISNLPSKVDIRIFNLAGTLVRKIEKDNDSQFQRWDLLNETGLPVASGLYIFHMDAPDLGKTKILKGFIIQAKQKLQYF